MKRLSDIRRELSEETGINFEEYYKPEVIDPLAETVALVISPVSVLLTMILYFFIILVGMVCVITGVSYFMKLTFWYIAFCVLIGLVGYPFISVPLGLKRVLSSLVKELANSLTALLDIAEGIINDLAERNDDGPTLKSIVKGIYFFIGLPVVCRVLRSKLWIFSKPFEWLTERLFIIFADSLSAIMDKLSVDATKLDTSSKALGKTMKAIDRDKAMNILGKVKPKIMPILLDSVLPKVCTPLTVVFYSSICLTLLGLGATAYVFSNFN